MISLIKAKGLSLIEVLISLMLISLILFGLDGAQLYSIKEIKIAYFYGIAVSQLNNATERLIALKMHEGLAEQYGNWNAENQQLLPAGFGTIAGTYPNYRVTVYWGNISHECKEQQIGLSGCVIQTIQSV